MTVRDDITEDTLLDGAVILRQPAKGYRAAIDPVLLAASVQAGEGEWVLDLGAGVAEPGDRIIAGAGIDDQETRGPQCLRLQRRDHPIKMTPGVQRRDDECKVLNAWIRHLAMGFGGAQG